MSSGLLHSTRVINLAKRSYATPFPLNENPLSEGGLWLNGAADGVDWGNMRSNGVHAYGTLATSVHDNTALLTGAWAADQYAQGAVFVDSPSNTYFPEVELRLRSAMSANVNRGYEVSFGCQPGDDAYLIIVRWNGAAESYDYLLTRSGAQYAIATGDVIRATIAGNIISAYKNDVLMNNVDITSIGGTVWSSGAPGMGTNANSGGSAFLDQYGFSNFMARDL